MPFLTRTTTPTEPAPQPTATELLALLREHGADTGAHLPPGAWPALQAAATATGQLGDLLLLEKAQRGHVRSEADPHRVQGRHVEVRPAPPTPAARPDVGTLEDVARGEQYDRITSPRHRLDTSA